MHPAFGLVAAYLLGSVPAAYLAGRAKAVDLRRHGSGNLGATNAWRVLGCTASNATSSTMSGFTSR